MTNRSLCQSGAGPGSWADARHDSGFRPQRVWSSLPRRWIAVLLLLVLSPSIWLIWSGRDLTQFGHFDEAVFWGAAHSLADGCGYRSESLPGEPYQTKYLRSS